MNTKPHFYHEIALWEQSIEYVVGMDEVGRGAFAGPVVVGAVVFPKDFHQLGLRRQLRDVRDSKALDPATRILLARKIRQHTRHWAVGAVPANVIDQIGMTRALQMAARQALGRLSATTNNQQSTNNLTGHHILTDANLLKKSLFSPNVTELVHGDAVCFSIASASILAKVWRDEYMRRLAHDRHQSHLKIYHWHQNAGYGTRYHQQVIRLYGPTPYHRLGFLKNLI